jgi:hypothetical protein
MKKILRDQKKFHGCRTQYDYWRTGRVLQKHFWGGVLTVHDRINLRSMYENPIVMDGYIDRI